MSITAVRTSLSGMMAAGKRLEAAASNIANLRTTGPTPDDAGETSAYRPVAVAQADTFGGGVSATLVARNPAFELQYSPDDPAADEAGMVAAPAVDLASEMVDVLQARIGYAASAKVMKVANEMTRTAIDTLA
ncbi:flagellar basal body rod protein FlgC [Chthonobacter albigriseus]|uniref:flagellar basal body rod protein FlgC n=1 Tax=Chthonobacter albigriseus TaxID=1683161 RepID=UPI0015EE6C7D|nr:flagellar basal body rod C-terminal domain-containing protein [Chthonobacter albigriseus]